MFHPLLKPARYKGARGGRGSGKSHFIAGLLIEDSLAEPGISGEGLRSVCIREVQKDLSQSSKLLLADKLSQMRLGEADGFKVFRDVIETPKDGIFLFKGMQDYTAESIKSLEKFKRAWWEEAQTATAHSLKLLRPTIRDEGSELLFSWNPRFEDDPVELLFGIERPTDAVCVTANWRDNPWWTSVLEEERQNWMRSRPGEYGHVWDGEYVTVVDGAYFAADLLEAKNGNPCRITNVSRDPLMTLRAVWDIGGTGAKADATAIWVCQFVGREIRVLDYYEAQGQPLSTHVQWLRDKGHGKALCILPHDGAPHEKVYDVSYESALKQAGFEVKVIPNQGKGAAKMRIEAARRLFPSIWFNEKTTGDGRKALGWYHEKRDPVRKMGLGPEHDWSSHGADAFGLMCVAYEEPQLAKKPTPKVAYTANSWMG